MYVLIDIFIFMYVDINPSIFSFVKVCTKFVVGTRACVCACLERERDRKR